MKIYILLFAVLFLQCTKTRIDPDDKLIGGVWVFEEYVQESDSVYREVYTRKDDFENGKLGISFKDNKKMINMQNAGFCATPSVYYEKSNGTWSKNKLGIKINSIGLNGKYSTNYEVIKLTDIVLELRSFK
jgi:hypothetical protein